MADRIWSVSDRARKVCRGGIRLLYYPLFVAHIIFASIAFFVAPPFMLLLIAANMSNIIAIWSVQRYGAYAESSLRS